MKRYALLITLLGIICCLIYLSSIYLVKAEISFKQLAQKTEELEEEFPLEELEEQEAVLTPIETEEQPAVITIAPSETPPESSPVIEEQVRPSGPPLISMEFESANLKDVLKIFCQQSGLNFIAGENVELKPVTLYLNNVGVDDALNTIIKANGLTYERAEGSNVFIVTKSAEPEIKLETRIFRLKYAFAEDKTIMGVDNTQQTIKGIKEAIQKLLTPNGDLSVDIRTNSLVITDIPSRFEIIEKAVNDLDSQLPQILIEARIVELSTTDLDQLGIRWTSLGGYTIRLQDPTRTYESERSGGQDRTDEYTTTTEDSSEFEDEIVSHPLTGTTSETVTTTDTVTSSVGRSLTDTLTRTLAKSDLRSAVLSADDFSVTLSLLLTDTNVDLISSPKIVTTHSKEAKITVGEQYPIPQFAYNDDTGTFEVQGFDYKDIGIILRVTPYADKEKSNITLELHPEVSSVSGVVNFRGIEIPIIATRDAITNVAIRDGDTLAIGGLLRDSNNTTITKVPLLGDIPVLGHLFRHKEATKTKTNLIIFITPHILDSRPAMGIGSEVSIPMAMAEQPEAVAEKQKAYQFGHR